MKGILTILILLCVLSLSAQVATPKLDSARVAMDSIAQRKLSVADTLKLKINKLDKKIVGQPQALQHKADSVDQKIQKSVANKSSKVDSTNQKISQTLDKVNGLDNKVADSLNQVVSKYESRLMTNRLTSKIDSLKSLGQPVEKYTAKLDSLENLNPLQKAQDKVGEGQTKIKELGGKPVTAINEKLTILSTESKGQGNLPGNVSLPSTDFKIPGADLTKDINLPNTKLNTDKKLPSLDAPSLDLKDQRLGKDLKTGIDLPKGLDTNLNKVNDLQKNTDELSKVSDKATGYTDDIKKIEAGKVDEVSTIKEDVVSKLPINEELNEIQKQDKLIKDQQAQLAAFKNPEAYKKQTIERSRVVIAQQMAAFEKVIQESVNKVSKYQSKMGTVLAYSKDLPKKRDGLKKLKTYERIMPGLTLQIQKPGAWLVDINPSLRYRMTLYWSAGLGWNERVIFGNYNRPHRESRVYGARAFTEVVIFKGISARLEAEDMNAFITPLQRTQDVGKRAWVWNYMVGVRKDFSFIPKVIGNAQFMYNAYTTHNHALYPTRFNVRFGFEPVLKKRKKKVKTATL